MATKGWHIAFFIFALLLLGAPADKYVFSRWQWAVESGFPVGRLAILLVAAAILFGFPALRKYSLGLLATPIPSGKAPEIAVALLLNLVCALGAVGAYALWVWSFGGEPAMARWIGNMPKADEQTRHAISVNAIITFFILGGIVAPIVEELVFRGMLFPAWAREWGWVRGALATSFLFAVIHPNVVSQFMASLVLICVFRRTRSLRASIGVHSAFNVLLWYPLAGKFLVPSGAETGEISHWALQLSCLALACVAVPLYLWASRDAILRAQS